MIYKEGDVITVLGTRYRCEVGKVYPFVLSCSLCHLVQQVPPSCHDLLRDAGCMDASQASCPTPERGYFRRVETSLSADAMLTALKGVQHELSHNSG